MISHPFDHAIALQRGDCNTFVGHTSPDYWNSISPFGGITAATLLQAMLRHPERLGDPIALTINFASAIRQGEFGIRAVPIRTGRSTQHWSFEVHQSGDTQPVVTGTAVFALRRPTWSETESCMPDYPGPEGLDSYRPPSPLPFLNRYRIRYIDSHPFAAAKSSQTQCWIEDVPPRALDLPAIAAYCDAFIPRLFVRTGRPSPISTVTMSVNFHIEAAELEEHPVRLAFAQARANVFQRGFHDQEGKLWAQDGRLLATTHQLVWFKD